MLILIALLAIVVVYLSLTFLVLVNNPKAALNRVLSALMFVIPAWSTVVFLEDVAALRDFVDILVRADYFLATVMIGLFYWFCARIARKKWQLLSLAVASLAVVCGILSLLNLMVTPNFSSGDLILESDKVGYPFFVSYLLMALGGGFWRLFSKLSESRGREKAQVTFVTLGLSLTVFSLILTIVIAPRVFGLSGADLTRIGLYSTLFFAGFSVYAVVRHRFMDIRLLVVRSIVYILLLFSLASIYILSVTQIGSLLFGGYESTVAQDLYNLAVVLIVAFSFQPLRHFFEKVTEKFFYKNKYDTQTILDSFSKVLASEIDLEKLLKKSVNKICNDLHIQSGQLVATKNKEIYMMEYFGSLPQWVTEKSLPIPSKNVVVAEEVATTKEGKALKQVGVRVAVRLATREGVMGYLFLGEKLSGDIYSTQDIRILEIMGKELAVAMSNATAYAEIKAFNQTLQQKVDEATKELRQKNERLRALDKAKDEFISTASHQMRTPLTTIKGYISMILEGQGGPLNKEHRRLLIEAFKGSERMVYLIADFLSVSRIRTDKFTIETKPVNLAELVKDEVGRLEVTAQNRGLSLVYNAPSHFPALMLDEEKIRQVVMNLVDNAIYYTKSGGTITVSLVASDKEVRFKVQDTGIGVPRNEQHQLFSKFFRASNALKMRPDGTGIGLFLVKKIIALHGGAMIFESKEGKGSTFGFSFPLRGDILVDNHVDKPADKERQ